MKIKWIISQAPTGLYRCWPRAQYSNGDHAGHINCVDSYTPGRARGEDQHAELEVWVADYSPQLDTNVGSFTNRRLKARFTDLPSAQAALLDLLEKSPHVVHPSFRDAK